MSLSRRAERRLLGDSEFPAVERSHYPEVDALSKPELIDLARQLREHRDKARDVRHALRREGRGKAEARTTRAPNQERLAEKKQVFAAALRRVNREIGRHGGEKLSGRAVPETQGEIARRALEMRRASRVRHHPLFRSAHEGMRPIENTKAGTGVNPGQVGSVSQQNKNFQAASDR